MEIDKGKLIGSLNKIFAANENDVNSVRLWVSEPHVLSHIRIVHLFMKLSFLFIVITFPRRSRLRTP